MKENLDRFKANRSMTATEQTSTFYYYYYNPSFLDKYNDDPEVSIWVANWLKKQYPYSYSNFKQGLKPFDYFELLDPFERELFSKDFLKDFETSIKEEEEKKAEIGKTELDPEDLVPGTLVLITNFGTDSEPRKYMWNKSKGEILTKNPDGTYKIRITDVKDSNVLYSKKWYDQEQRALTQKINMTRNEFKTLKEIENVELKAKEDAERAKLAAEKAKGDAEKAKAKEDKSKEENIRRISRKLL